MTSDLFRLVYQEQLAEHTQQLAEYTQQLAAMEQQMEQQKEVWYEATQQLLADALSLRFPDAPLRLLSQIRQIHDIPTLQTLHHTILVTNDLPTIEQAITNATMADAPHE